jgi:RNA polymerase sigma-70 factor (ECF subfamily)
MLEGLKVRDPKAWTRLVDVWGPVIYGWCRQHELEANDAADISQEVLLRVLLKVSEFERKTFRGWVWQIAHRKIVDLCRQRNRQPRALGGSGARRQIENRPDPDCAGLGQDPEEGPASDMNSLVVRRLLGVIRADFPERTYQAFWRTAVDGLTAAEVAEELGMTIAAVRQAKCRVLKRLREELDGML